MGTNAPAPRCSTRTALQVAFILTLLVLTAGTAPAGAATRHALPGAGGVTCSQASPCSVSTAVSGAVTGDTVSLGAGNYGSFTGAAKSGTVTISAPPGVSATMGLTFTSASNLVLDGLTVTGGSMVGSTRNITVRNSNFTAPLVIDGLANANILLDANRHNNQNSNSSCTDTPARIHLSYGTDTPSGVTVQNSVFDGGNKDGIQTGAPLTIRNNRFSNIRERSSSDCQHTDPIQGVGTSGMVVTGNLIHDSADGIVDFDDTGGGVYMDNACYSIDRAACITLYSDSGSRVEYNTAGAGMRVLELDKKPGHNNGAGTIVRNNVGRFTAVSSTLGTRTNNLYPSAPAPDLSGSPTFVSPSPDSLSDFALAPGSPGKTAATDGSDVGVRVASTPSTDSDGDGVPDLQDACPNIAAPGTLNGCPLDATAPDTSITAQPPASTTSTSASFSFTSTEAGSTFSCRLDAGAWSTCSSPKAYSGLSVAAHTFQVRATDAAANTDATPASASWSVAAVPPAPDTAAPETTIDSGRSGSDTAADASFGFSSSESGGTFECRLDAAAWAACTSPRSYLDVALGAHTFAVRAIDAAGNVDATPATRSFDRVEQPPPTPAPAPDTTITSAPSASTGSQDAVIAFTTSTPSTGLTFECSLDGQAFVACSSPRTLAGLSAGGHTFSVRAVNSAGLADPSPASTSWTVVVDGSVLLGTSTVGSNRDSVAAGLAEAFPYAARADGIAGSLSVYLDTGSAASTVHVGLYADAGGRPGALLDSGAVTSPVAEAWNDAPLRGGAALAAGRPYWIAIMGSGGTLRFRDVLGGCRSWTSASSTLASLPATWSSGASWETCSLAAVVRGGGSAPPATDGTPDPGGTAPPLPPIADTTPPETTIVGGTKSRRTSRSASFSFVANEAGAGFQCSIDRAGFRACISPVTYRRLSVGPHLVEVRAIDVAGNIDPTPDRREWTIVLSKDQAVNAGGRGRCVPEARGWLRARAVRLIEGPDRAVITGVAPAAAVRHGTARIRLQVRRSGSWRTFASRRVRVTARGRFRLLHSVPGGPKRIKVLLRQQRC